MPAGAEEDGGVGGGAVVEAGHGGGLEEAGVDEDGGVVFGVASVGIDGDDEVTGGHGVALVFDGVGGLGDAELAEVGEAFDGIGLIPRLVEGGEEDGDQEGDDANDDEELDEGEGYPT